MARLAPIYYCSDCGYCRQGSQEVRDCTGLLLPSASVCTHKAFRSRVRWPTIYSDNSGSLPIPEWCPLAVAPEKAE